MAPNTDGPMVKLLLHAVMLAVTFVICIGVWQGGTKAGCAQQYEASNADSVSAQPLYNTGGDGGGDQGDLRAALLFWCNIYLKAHTSKRHHLLITDTRCARQRAQ